MQDGLADSGDRAGIIDIRSEIASVVDTAEHPSRVGRDTKKAEPRTIGRRAMHRKAARRLLFEADGALPRDRVADAGLRTRRRDDHAFATLARGFKQGGEARGIDAVVVAEEEFHARQFSGDARKGTKVDAAGGRAEVSGMKKYPVTLLQIGMLSGTRATAAAGLALVLASRIPREKRAAIGWSLLGAGSIFYLTLVADVVLRNKE